MTIPTSIAAERKAALRNTVKEIRQALDIPPLLRKPARLYLDGFCDGIAYVLGSLVDGEAHSYDFQQVKGFADGVFHARTELGITGEDR
jgi:hypothetical protein